MFIFSFCCDAKRKNEPKKKNTLYQNRLYSIYLQNFLTATLNENFVRKYKESVIKTTMAKP